MSGKLCLTTHQGPTSDTRSREKRSYSEEDKHIALIALDLNGGNVFRTAKARGIPYCTLHDWARAREKRRAEGIENPRAKELRGDLATKMESLLHDIVEIMPTKLEKATLSQLAVTAGILTDKLRILRGPGLDHDPANELCRILGIHRDQLPTRLELKPEEELREGWGNSGGFIDVQPEPEHHNGCVPNAVVTSREGLEGVSKEPTGEDCNCLGSRLERR